MGPLAVVFGGLLVAVGLIGYLQPGIFGTFDKISPTALIPAIIGGVIAFCGLLTIMKPSARKHAMHLAALAAVVGVLGGFMPLMRSQFNFEKASAISGLLTIGVSLAFVLLCIKSFIAARQDRKQKPPVT